MARINEHTNMATVLEVMEISGALRGKSFSITGHLGRPRKDIEAIIEKAGGEFHKTPNYYTTFLITNKDWTAKTARKGASNKLLKAQENGTRIITEQQFYDMLVEADEAQQDE